MISEISISSNIISVGSSRFIRECAIPTIEDIEPLANADFETLSFEKFEQLKNSKPQADANTAPLIGLLIGVGSWAAAKVLNDIYAETLGKKVRSCVKRIVDPTPENSEKAVAIVVGNFKNGAIAIIAATGKTEQELLEAEANIPKAIAAISNFPIESNPDRAVYLYRLSGSNLSLVPEQHESVKEAIGSMCKAITRES